MANINFGLNIGRESIKNKEYSIYIRYRFGRTVDFKKTIGFKIILEHWNSKTQFVKNRSEIKNRQKINNLIKKLKRHFEDFEDDLISEGKRPTLENAKESYQRFFENPDDSKEISIPNTLLKYFDFYIKNRQTNSTIKESTIRSYKLTEKSLKKFNNEVYPIDFQNIDMDFYYCYIEWNEDQNYALNYIGKHIKNLKAVLNDATENEFNVNLKFKNKKFKVLREEVDNVYLSLEELNRIFKLELSQHPKLDQARDLFLFGAYTGMRVSNFNYLEEFNLYEYIGETYLKIKTVKVPKGVVIPLRPELKAILKKHGNKPPKGMLDQEINDKIKEVCENAGIDEKTSITKTLGGKKVKITKFKFDWVTTHTARRSFCTNAYLSGMNPIDIMQISSHTSEKTFLNYIKADALQKAVKISSHPFFKGEDC